MSYEKKSKDFLIDKKKPFKTLKSKSSSTEEHEYKDLDIETIKSSRDNFLVWKDFSGNK